MRPSHLSLSLLVLVAALLPAGCAEQDPSLLLSGYYFAVGKKDEATGAISACVYPATAANDTVFAQDVSINLQQLRDGGQDGDGRRNIFTFGANVTNRLQPNASGGQSLRVDTNTILLKSAAVRFLFTNEVIELNRAFSVTIGPNGSAGFGIPLINGAGDIDKLVSAIGAEGAAPNQVLTVTTEIVVRGTLLDGMDVESNILEFPVNLCVNCPELLSTTPACIGE